MYNLYDRSYEDMKMKIDQSIIEFDNLIDHSKSDLYVRNNLESRYSVRMFLYLINLQEISDIVGGKIAKCRGMEAEISKLKSDLKTCNEELEKSQRKANNLGNGLKKRDCKISELTKENTKVKEELEKVKNVISILYIELYTVFFN